MSWLSDAFHGVESFVQSNESWLLPVAIGGAALATGGLALGAFGGAGLFGAEAAGEGAGLFGAGEAAGEAGAFGAGAAGIEGGVGGTAADVAAAEAAGGAAGAVAPGAVDITVSPFVGAAADIAGGTDVAALEAGTAAGEFGAEVPGVAGAIGSDALSQAGPLDTLLAGGIGSTGPEAADVAGTSLASAGEAPELGTQVAADLSEQGAAEAPAFSPSETVTSRFPLPDSGEAMPTGGTFSQAQSVGAASPQSFAGTPAGPTGLPPEITTGESLPSSAAAAGDPAAGGLRAAGAGLDQTLAGAGKGIEGALSSPWVKYGLPLGIMGATFLRGPGSLPPQTKGALDLANQQASFGATQLTLANQGQILPAQQAQLDQNAQNAKNQLYQLYASRGIDPNKSTDFIQASQQIDQQTLAARSAIIQTMITNGLNFETAASNVLTQAANQQVALDNNFRSSISSAMGSFGLMAALGSRGGGTTQNVGASSISTG